MLVSNKSRSVSVTFAIFPELTQKHQVRYGELLCILTNKAMKNDIVVLVHP